MNLTLTNQMPAVLDPLFQPSITGVPDLIATAQKLFVDPVLTPTAQTGPAELIESDNNQNRTVPPDEITEHIVNAIGDQQSQLDDLWSRTFYKLGLIYYDETSMMLLKELFTVQALLERKLPLSSTQIYTIASDVIPAAKGLLANHSTPKDFFASIAMSVRPDILGFACKNAAVFDDFKTFVKGQLPLFMNSMSQNDRDMFTDFDQNCSLTHELTESLILRKDDGDQQHDLSFARVLHRLAMDYAILCKNGQNNLTESDFFVLPFTMGELVNPRNIVFVNVELHARSTSSKIADEWKLIKDSVSDPVTIVKANKLKKLTAMRKTAQKFASAAATAAKQTNQPAHRVLRVKFSKTRPTYLDLGRKLKKIMNKMTSTSKTMNTYKLARNTFSKPNRRDPDDFNRQGVMLSTKYRPDIHLYIDTSGSISEQDYESAVKMCIKMARSLDVNLYVNFFSHFMTQCYKLKVKGRSMGQIYHDFQTFPKADGGTDYTQIWRYINRLPKRVNQLSLVITDFEFSAPNTFIPHPKNLYYAPCATVNWQHLTHEAEHFCQTMEHNDPKIRKHLLF